MTARHKLSKLPLIRRLRHCPRELVVDSENPLVDDGQREQNEDSNAEETELENNCAGRG